LIIEVVNNTCLQLTTMQNKGIFQKFYRAEGSQYANPHGVGLGLFYSKEICERLIGGQLSFQSIPLIDGNTKVCVTLRMIANNF
jgi:signal transduction histidine kinase